jgi:hypothetical protein
MAAHDSCRCDDCLCSEAYPYHEKGTTSAICLQSRWGVLCQWKVGPALFCADFQLIKYSKSQFTFVGTNAYWLPTLNSDEDIDNTLASIAASNIKVVRLWGFNGSIHVTYSFNQC